MTTANCKNCGFALRPADRFCPACGQAVLDSQDRSVAHLLRSSAAELASVDSRLWRSLRLLAFKPGFLSREYRQGRRKRYLTPIGLFLLANLLYFLAPPLSDLTLSLAEQYELQLHRTVVVAWVDSYMTHTGLTFDEVASMYQLRVVELAKLMVIVHVPILAFATLLLVPDRRFYFADHVVAALHYFAFLMIYLIAFAAFFTVVYFAIPGDGPTMSPYLIQGVVLLQFAYVPVMLRTAFDLAWWRALLSTLPYIAGLLAANLLYRLVQFVVSFWLVSLA